MAPALQEEPVAPVAPELQPARSRAGLLGSLKGLIVAAARRDTGGIEGVPVLGRRQGRPAPCPAACSRGLEKAGL